jgi:hypothetical protein
MSPFTASILTLALRLLIVTAGLVYAGLVLTGYVTEGPHYQPRLRLAEPARSGERLLVWWGIKLVDFILRFTRWMLEILYDASAEVGRWAVNKSNPETQNRIRNRFLV